MRLVSYYMTGRWVACAQIGRSATLATIKVTAQQKAPRGALVGSLRQVMGAAKTYADFLRRSAPATNIRPRPSMPQVDGSGTADTLILSTDA